MNVSQIRYQPIEGGTLGGLFALHVRLGGNSKLASEFFSFDAAALAKMIHDSFNVLKFEFKGVDAVLFDCRFVDKINTEEMLSLLGILRDWKIHTFAWVNEDTRYAWFEYINYITVFVRSTHWPNFKVSEIRYIPSDDSLFGDAELAEPEIYDVNAKAAKYIWAVPPLNTEHLLKFVKSATQARWGVILPTQSLPGVEFPLRRKE